MLLSSERGAASINLQVFDPIIHSAISISYGVVKSSFGWCFIAASEYGICKISFSVSDEPSEFLTELEKSWPDAVISKNQRAIIPLADKIFDKSRVSEIDVIVKATPFQFQVWQALLTIPHGNFCSYADIAELIGSPAACRAVGSAIGKNPIAYLIPCHRVIQKSGSLGGYRWGVDCKKEILLHENSHFKLPANRL